jgi:OOP family OmpA-OmpF porin
MRNKKVILTGLSMMALALSSYTAAGARPGAVSIRLADGYIFFAKKRNLENTSTPTIELGYEFSEKWGMKGGVTVINTNTNNAGPDHGVHGFIYTLDGVYKFPTYGYFEPYVLAGIGVTSVNPPNNSTDPNNEANLNAGIGSHFFIDPSISLNAEAKDLYVMSGGKNDVMLTAGVTFYFGGETPKSESVNYKGENK